MVLGMGTQRQHTSSFPLSKSEGTVYICRKLWPYSVLGIVGNIIYDHFTHILQCLTTSHKTEQIPIVTHRGGIRTECSTTITALESPSMGLFAHDVSLQLWLVIPLRIQFREDPLTVRSLIPIQCHTFWQAFIGHIVTFLLRSTTEKSINDVAEYVSPEGWWYIRRANACGL